MLEGALHGALEIMDHKIKNKDQRACALPTFGLCAKNDYLINNVCELIKSLTSVNS